jgi:hypothetical protein
MKILKYIQQYRNNLSKQRISHLHIEDIFCKFFSLKRNSVSENKNES